MPRPISHETNADKGCGAGYGESLRKFLAEKTNPKILIDFAGQKIFESATVDTNILLFQKAPNTHKTTVCVAKAGCREDLSGFIRHHSMAGAFNTSGSWVILNPIEQSIKAKIERIGKPLKDWDIKIYRGILTGCNEAFIIDAVKRDEILANCITQEERRRTYELIRPITLIPACSKFAHLSLFALPTLIGYDITPLSAGFVALTRIGLMELAERGKGQIAG